MSATPWSDQPSISLEFFPPKTPEGVGKLQAVRAQLYELRPQYCSVTYGAGGSTQDGTLQTVQAILAEGMEAAPHLSCIGATRATMLQQLDLFKANKIRRLVALRGDLPSGAGGGAFGEFRYASDLVAFIREHAKTHTGEDFHIDVAAYPEVHPQARSAQSDMQAFVSKVLAGADAAITQYFFNADAYWRFVDEAQRHGVAVPIIAGIMPITNASQLLRFSDACGAEVPRWIRQRLIGFGDDSASIKAFGLDVVSSLVQRLQEAGAPGFHFYTMNQAQPTLSICKQALS